MCVCVPACKVTSLIFEVNLNNPVVSLKPISAPVVFSYENESGLAYPLFVSTWPGVPTIHDKGLVIQPDYNGSFSYGALVNNDGVVPATVHVPHKRPSLVLPSPPTTKSSNLKKD